MGKRTQSLENVLGGYLVSMLKEEKLSFKENLIILLSTESDKKMLINLKMSYLFW